MAPNDGTVTFAVEADGQVIGLIQYSEKNEQDDRHAAIDIFLHPDWHGRALGADTIRHWPAICSSSGTSEVIPPESRQGAAALLPYQQRGHSVHGNLRLHIG